MKLKKITLLLYLFYLLVLFSGCGDIPVLNSSYPTIAFPGQVIQLNGSWYSGIVWFDFGTDEQRRMDMTEMGYYAQIPFDATPGTHSIAVSNSRGTSNTINITILENSSEFPPPRIERAMILSANETQVAGWRLQIANIDLSDDISTSISVSKNWGNVPLRLVTNTSAKVRDISTIDPSTYRYPIYHYSTIDVWLEDDVDTWDKEYRFTLDANNGSSNSLIIESPPSYIQRDTDYDGIVDEDELGAFVTPEHPLNLPELGCNHMKKDILVEVDWFEDIEIDPFLWGVIENAFEYAPVLNPDGTYGINIIIDRGQDQPEIGLPTGPMTGGNAYSASSSRISFAPDLIETDFYSIKENNFNTHRNGYFHYCIFAIGSNTSYPIGVKNGQAETPGDDFFVCRELEDPSNPVDSDYFSRTFIHELGHNLSLLHGGVSEIVKLLNSPITNPDYTVDRYIEGKINHFSLMNPRFDRTTPTYNDCSLSLPVTFPIIHQSYSEGMNKSIDESNFSESTGVCNNVSLDMNNDGDVIDSTPPSININYYWDFNIDKHHDHNEWGYINLNCLDDDD